jgi:glycosyltransferase involved in cell wall biosynthesis
MASASRGAGGLFPAVRSLANQVTELGCEVEVFTGRDQYSEEDCLQWGQVPVRVLQRFGSAAFGFLPELGSRLVHGGLELIHAHGLWMYPSVAVRRWGRCSRKPWLVSPHGMLDPWAIQNARWKKRVAGLLYEDRHLYGAACLHALCGAEADAFRAYGLTNPIAVIPNGVDLPELPQKLVNPEWATQLPKHARVLLFLGRLHPKKGLPALLQAWERVSGSTDAPWFLVVAGWDQNGHQSELERLVARLGIEGSVRFVGPQFGEQKAASLQRADAFILPSLSEGLPMAVLEAWAYRLPVVMTPHCNLPDGFIAGAALAIEADSVSICDGLTRLFELSDEARGQMGTRGRHLVKDRFTWSSVASNMCDVYRWVLDQGDQPACVSLD